MNLREIDAQVAGAMGYEILEVGYFGCRGKDSMWPHETPRQVELTDWLDRVGIESIGTYYINVESDWWRETNRWQPSTDIAVAWQVVEWMNKHKKWIVLIWAYPNRTQVRVYSAQKHLFFPTTKGQADGDTIPLAICLAFLKAVEER